MSMRTPAIVPVLLLEVAFAGCACQVETARFIHAAPGTEWVRTELAFGLGLSGGRTIEPAEWQSFLDEVVTPRFPDGLTVVDAHGRWRNAAGRMTAEPSKILILFHPPDPAASARIEEIRELCKKRFGQESVLRATSPAKTSF